MNMVQRNQFALNLIPFGVGCLIFVPSTMFLSRRSRAGSRVGLNNVFAFFEGEQSKGPKGVILPIILDRNYNIMTFTSQMCVGLHDMPADAQLSMFMVRINTNKQGQPDSIAVWIVEANRGLREAGFQTFAAGLAQEIAVRLSHRAATWSRDGDAVAILRQTADFSMSPQGIGGSAADARACDSHEIENVRPGPAAPKDRAQTSPRSHRRTCPRPASPSDRAPCAWASVRAGEVRRRTLARATATESRTSAPAVLSLKL